MFNVGRVRVHSVESMVQQVAALLSGLRSQQVLSEQEIYAVLQKDLTLPCSIFSHEHSSLEAIVLYLRDQLHLRNKDVSSLLKRDSRVISRTYAQALKKKVHTNPLDYSSSFPLSILASKKHSVLETLALYFAHQKKSIHEIAELLHRDYQTIWTVLQRAKKK
jgi:hypothetical protein